MKKYLLVLGVLMIISVVWLVVAKQSVTNVGNVANSKAPSSTTTSSIQDLKMVSGYSLLISSGLVSLVSADDKTYSCSVDKGTRFFTKSLGATPQVGDILVATYNASLSRVEAMILSRNTDIGSFRMVHPEKDAPLNVVMGVVDSVKDGVASVRTEDGKGINVSYNKRTNIVLDKWLIDSPVSKSDRAEVSCTGKNKPVAQTVVLYK